jgi:hypothetical protein
VGGSTNKIDQPPHSIEQMAVSHPQKMIFLHKHQSLFSLLLKKQKKPPNRSRFEYYQLSKSSES